MISMRSSPMSRDSLGKQPGGGLPGRILPPAPAPAEPPCHSSCSRLWGGLGSGAVSRPLLRSPSFSPRRAPPRYVRSRNGPAAPWPRVTAGGPGWPRRRERVAADRRGPCPRCAAPPGHRAAGFPNCPLPRRLGAVVSLRLPHVPRLSCGFWGIALGSDRRSPGRSGGAGWGERSGFVFEDRLPSSRSLWGVVPPWRGRAGNRDGPAATHTGRCVSLMGPEGARCGWKEDLGQLSRRPWGSALKPGKDAAQGWAGRPGVPERCGRGRAKVPVFRGPCGGCAGSLALSRPSGRRRPGQRWDLWAGVSLVSYKREWR